MVQLKGFRFKEGINCGCPHLLEAISKLNNLKLFVFLGIYMNLMVLLNPKWWSFINASLLNREYQMTNIPISKKI
jgi:hypothetical protein